MISYIVGFIIGFITALLIMVIALKKMEKDGEIIYKEENNRYSKVDPMKSER